MDHAKYFFFFKLNKNGGIFPRSESYEKKKKLQQICSVFAGKILRGFWAAKKKVNTGSGRLFGAPQSREGQPQCYSIDDVGTEA